MPVRQCCYQNNLQEATSSSTTTSEATAPLGQAPVKTNPVYIMPAKEIIDNSASRPQDSQDNRTINTEGSSEEDNYCSSNDCDDETDTRCTTSTGSLHVAVNSQLTITHTLTPPDDNDAHGEQYDTSSHDSNNDHDDIASLEYNKNDIRNNILQAPTSQSPPSLIDAAPSNERHHKNGSDDDVTRLAVTPQSPPTKTSQARPIRRNSLSLLSRNLCNDNDDSLPVTPPFTTPHHHHHQQQQQPPTNNNTPPQQNLHHSRTASELIRKEAINAFHQLPIEEIESQDRFFHDVCHIAKMPFWHRMAIKSCGPDAGSTEIIKRGTFLLLSSLTVGAGSIWGCMYLALEEYVAACAPFVYSVAIGCAIMMCAANTTTYQRFVFTQLFLILVLPFSVHLILGGLQESGGVMMWSFLCPLGAAFFRSSAEGLTWFQIYFASSAGLLAKEFIPRRGEDGARMEPVIPTVTMAYYAMNILGAMSIVFAAAFQFARELEAEYDRSESLLNNILPRPIARRIKRGELPIIDNFSGVTILFADLVGFTRASTEHHPNFLIGAFLKDVFANFDRLVERRGLEKIKTIGDAYMIVGGLSESYYDHDDKSNRIVNRKTQGYGSRSPALGPPLHHSSEIMLMAAEIFQALDRINQKYGMNFQLRIGVHTGPVIAGVLGLKKFAYDVWGDSVNTASRMESGGLPGIIQISAETYEMVRYDLSGIFEFEARGEQNVKGKGVMETYLAYPKK